MKLRELFEEEVVDIIAKKAVSKPGHGEYLFYPEDARDVLPRGPRIIYSIDAYSVKSLKLPWRDYSDVGWSALVGAISDVITKGGVPHACLIALGLPRDMNLADLENLISGMQEASQAYGVRILGGDTNESSDAWIAVSVIGFTTAKMPPSRRGLKEGDVIIVTGLYGAMGYVAKHGIEASSKLEWVVNHTKRPQISSEISSVIENYYKVISATMDVSDGLGYTLSVMSRLSGVAIQIENPPKVFKELADLCADNVKCLLEYALAGGEEYGVVMGVKPDFVKAITSELDYFEVPYAVVGKAISGQPGIYYQGQALPVTRYDQFRGWSVLA